jgi:hypothetical protein
MRRFGSFLVVCVVVMIHSTLLAQNPDPDAAQKYGWGFDNFTDPSFNWDIYSHSFYGVPVDSNATWATATFDKLFYEQAFKTKLPDPSGSGTGGAGNCFGISLLSLMVNRFGGYYGYCAPTISYGGDTGGGNGGPSDPALHRIINIMHGRQLSLAALEAYFDQSRSGHSQHSSYGVQLAKEVIGKEGPCIVSITNEENPADGSGGHTMIAYGVTGTPPNMRIWVVDPNRIWVVDDPSNRGWYTSNQNFITCNTGTGSWSFTMAGGDVYPSGNGNLIILPASLVGPPGRVPSSLGLAVGELITKLLLSGNTDGGTIGH